MAQNAGTQIESLDGLLKDLRTRVYNLEQRLTNPSVAVGNGMKVNFPEITVGPPGEGPVVVWDSTAPTGLTATPGALFDDIYVDLVWVPAVDATTVEYDVQIAEYDSTSDTYGVASMYRSAADTMRIHGLLPNTEYGVRVFGVNAIGVYSEPTPWVRFDTAADATVPGQVTGLKAVAGVTSITLTWTENPEQDVARGNGTYTVQQSTDNTFPDTADTVTVVVSGTITSFTGLSGDNEYFYRVQANDASGNPGIWSATVSATPGQVSYEELNDGAAPVSSPVPVITPGVGFAFVRWTPVANAGPVTYDVYVSTDPTVPTGSTAGRVGSVTEGTMVTVRTSGGGAALVPETDYYVRVIARDGDGSAEPSDVVGPFQTRLVDTEDFATGSITAASGIIADLDAGVITVGTLSGDRIASNAIIARHILSGQIVTDHITAYGLSASVITFGTMSGDRIQANTLDVNALETSTLTARTLTMGSGGSIRGGSANPASTGYLIDDFGIRLMKGGNPTVTMNGTTGDVTISGTLHVGGGSTFAGNITSSAIITGSTINGGTINGGTVRTASSGRRVQLSSAVVDQIDFYSGVAGEKEVAHIRMPIANADYVALSLNSGKMAFTSNPSLFRNGSRIDLFSQSRDGSTPDNIQMVATNVAASNRFDAVWIYENGHRVWSNNNVPSLATLGAAASNHAHMYLGPLNPQSGVSYDGNPSGTSVYSLTFGNNGPGYYYGRTGQMVNLYETRYGIGVQYNTAYIRTASRFCVFRGGYHVDNDSNPGAGGNVLIDVTTSGLLVNGLASFSSTRAIKKNIKPIREALEIVMALEPVRYNPRQWDEDEQGPLPTRASFVAEEVADVYPEAAVYDYLEGESRLHGVDALALVSLLTRGLQELREEVRTLRKVS